MKASRRIVHMFLFVALLLGGLSGTAGARGTETNDRGERPSGQQAIEISPTNQIIVKYHTETQAFGEAAQEAQMQRLSEAAGVRLTYFRLMSGEAHVLRLPERMAGQELKGILTRLMALPEVEYAEPDAMMQPTLTPNDPNFSQQWHYLPPASGFYGINATGAWDITTGSSNVVVAVLDTGYLDHADMVGRFVPGYDMISDAMIGNDGNARDNDAHDPGDWITAAENASGYFAGCAVHDSSWHGTHVAGTIAANTNNNLGVAGVNWSAKILPVRVLGKCGGFTSDIADGIRWAAGVPVAGVPNNPNPADVMNLSLGGSGACSATYQTAIDAAVAAGTTVVVAAGNEGMNAGGYQPASCNNVIAVAATTYSGDMAYYSNYGAVVDIAAPGGETYVDTDGILSTLNTGLTSPASDNYVFYQGTSMAAPHVAGAASLLYSTNPSITPAQVLTVLRNTVTAFPGGSGCNTSICGSGIVNAGAALASSSNQAPVLNPIGNKTVGVGNLLTFTATASDPNAGQTLTFSLGAGAPVGASINASSGVFTWTPSASQGPATHPITVRVTDNGSPAMSDSETIQVTVTDPNVNVPPVLEPIGNQSVIEGVPLAFTASASDANVITLISEGFDGTTFPPANWIRKEADGDNTYQWVRDTALKQAGSGAAYHPWGSGSAAENGLLVTPEFTVPANRQTVLSFWERAAYPGFYTAGSHSVWVCTGAGNCNNPPTNYSQVAETGRLVDDAWRQNQVTLAPYGSSTVVRLAFRYSGTNGDGWLIDTVNVSHRQVLTFSLDGGAPAGASINASSGAFAWTPTTSQGGSTYPVTVRVTDNGAPVMHDFETIQISVTDTSSTPPVLNPIGNKNVNEGSALSFTASATTLLRPAANLISEGFESATFPPTGWTRHEVDGDNSVQWERETWDPHSGVGNASHDYGDGLTNEDGMLITPEFTVPAGAQGVLTFWEAAWLITFYKPGGHSIWICTGAGNCNNPPTNYTQLVETGAFTDYEWRQKTVNLPVSGSSTVMRLAFRFNQVDGDNWMIDDVSVDTVGGPAPLSFSLSSAPAGASINAETGVFTWTPNEAQGPGAYSFAVNVTESTTPIGFARETITVSVAEVNAAPVLAAIGNKTVSQGAAMTFTASATDADRPANSLTFSLSGAPAGAKINSHSGVFTWVPSALGTYTFSVTVTDGGSPARNDTKSVTVTVVETLGYELYLPMIRK